MARTAEHGVLDHQGANPAEGWRVYWAYPADRDASCAVRQVQGTARFIDCEDRELDVTELAPGEGVRPIVENRRRLSLDLRAVVASGNTTPG